LLLICESTSNPVGRFIKAALTRIYRKLGVRSRAELAHLLAAKT
jgi:hypothetical protein